jgi:hypothetical protein
MIVKLMTIQKGIQMDKSKIKLNSLGFDPIEQLVIQYEKLKKEVEYYEGWRDGTIVPLTSTGKTRTYNAEVHMAVYDRLIKISESLLRYGYGRVSETSIVENKNIAPLVINLHKEGEVYQIGGDV